MRDNSEACGFQARWLEAANPTEPRRARDGDDKNNSRGDNQSFLECLTGGTGRLHLPGLGVQ